MKKDISPKDQSRYDVPIEIFLQCPDCMKGLTGGESTGKLKKIYYYYHCHTGKHLRAPVEQIRSEFRTFQAELISKSYFKNVYQAVVVNLLDEKLSRPIK